jgi:TldD protein
MSYDLPTELERLRPFLPELVAEATKRAPYASCLVCRQAGVYVSKSPSDDRVNPVPPQPGLRISVWDGATFHSVATNKLTDRSYLMKLCRDLAGSITVRPGPMPEPEPKLDRHFASTCRGDPDKVDTKTKQDLCRAWFEKVTATDKRVVNCVVNYMHAREYRLFCNNYRLLSSDVSSVVVFVVAFASDGTRQVMNYDVACGPGHEAASLDDARLRSIAELAVAYLSAERIAAGEYRVILDPDVAGTLAHESFGHGCELDTMMRGAARASAYIGRRVGSDLVNISDFGGIPGRNGTIFFSDDGVLATEPAVLVKDGVLQPTMMTDRYSYMLMKDRLPGLRLSANGRLENYDHPIYARMTNTYFEPLPRGKGGMTLDEMVKDTGDGILLEKLTSGMEDPLGWGVQLQVLRGREIKAGGLSGKLFYQLGLTGYVPDVLASVDGLTTELEMSGAGTCGKGHKENVRTATGGPYVRCRMKVG